MDTLERASELLLLAHSMGLEAARNPLGVRVYVVRFSRKGRVDLK